MATRPGTPAITTPGKADRATQQAIDQIRERFRQIEALIAQIQAVQAGAAVPLLVVSTLQRQVAELAAAPPSGSGARDALLTALLAQPNGLVVLRDGALITRTLVPGANVLITNPGGYAGNPVISSAGGGGTDFTDFFLTTEDGVTLISEDNLELMQEFRIDSSTSLQDETGLTVELTTEGGLVLLTE